MRPIHLLCLLLFSGAAFAAAPDPNPSHRQALLARIPPTNLKELLTFASLYRQTPEGEIALKQAWAVLSTQVSSRTPPPLPPNFGLMASSLVRLVHPTLSFDETLPCIPEDTIALIEEIGSSLPHRSLKGHKATSLAQIQALSPEEIDMGRALLLIDKDLSPSMTSVEAALDVLALQVLAQVGPGAADEAKISALTNLLFDDLSIRFPPESEAVEKTKQFSDLSSVLFSRRGVCLGASALYLTLAQRIGLPLSVYTPPGHIFVAYTTPSHTRVIETTARGIDIPLDRYLGLTLRSVPERSKKEVIGMVLFNRASEYLKKKDWNGALQLYHKAALFENDEELSLLISLCDHLSGRTKASQQRAISTLRAPPPYRREPDLLLVDLANGLISRESAETVIQWSDATGDERTAATEALQKAMSGSPKSFVVPFHLAHAWLELGRPKEALPLIERLAQRDDAPCSIHVLLAQLHLDRMNMVDAWKEVYRSVDKVRGDMPKPLVDLIIELQAESPSCQNMSFLEEPSS